jgi:hypothetical protein
LAPLAPLRAGPVGQLDLADLETTRVRRRVRHDRVDKTGCVTLRYQSQLRHLSIGRAHKGQRVVLLAADTDVRIVTEDGELLRHLTLDPTRDYQPRGAT